MSDQVWRYLLVVGASMAKTALGPVTAYGLKLSLVEAVPLCATGVMLTMVLAATVGVPVREFIARRIARWRASKGKARSDGTTGLDGEQGTGRSKVSPRVLAIWTRWGVPGLAFLTPVLLSPPGGALAAIALAVPRRRMLLHMVWSSVFWSTVFNVALYRLAGVLGVMAER
jgi:uncharacterized membrane protein